MYWNEVRGGPGRVPPRPEQPELFPGFGPSKAPKPCENISFVLRLGGRGPGLSPAPQRIQKASLWCIQAAPQRILEDSLGCGGSSRRFCGVLLGRRFNHQIAQNVSQKGMLHAWGLDGCRVSGSGLDSAFESFLESLL